MRRQRTIPPQTQVKADRHVGKVVITT